MLQQWLKYIETCNHSFTFDEVELLSCLKATKWPIEFSPRLNGPGGRVGERGRFRGAIFDSFGVTETILSFLLLE